MKSIDVRELLDILMKIPGGYEYSGACSLQICFPLKAGGELRFSIIDDSENNIDIDLYDGALPPCISGPSRATGK